MVSSANLMGVHLLASSKSLMKVLNKTKRSQERLLRNFTCNLLSGRLQTINHYS